MEQAEFDKKEREYNAAMMEDGLLQNRQEMIRRNIEACVSVIKVSSAVKAAVVLNEALERVSALMKELKTQ